MERVQFIKFYQQSRTITSGYKASSDLFISGISIDSRTLKPGECFIAISGEKFNGHQFIENAINSGAKAIVHHESHLISHQPAEIEYIPVTDTLQFLMEFAGWYRSLFNIPVIGITGSAGKTTTKEMLSSILQQKYQIAKTKKNMNNFIGTSLTLLDLLNTTEIAVVEMGTNHPGEIEILSQMVKPTHAAITNIGSGHIGFFGSKEAIYKEKTALFDSMKDESTIFINIDDPFLLQYKNPRLYLHSFAVNQPADYQARIISLNSQGCARFAVNQGLEIQLSIPGKHQVENALIAAAIGLNMGVSQKEVRKGLENITKTDKRMETMRIKSVSFINDAYNANPESMQAAIDFLVELPLKTGCKKILILGDMLELGAKSENYHRKIGKYLGGKKIDEIYCLGEDSRFIIEELKKLPPNGIKYHFFDTYEDTVQQLRQTLEPDDVVLLKGSRGMALENILTLLENED
jgi:UDP-N-acetylmuramoyl-tripeptide--D-alanyl-D-alanine ligase